MATVSEVTGSTYPEANFDGRKMGRYTFSKGATAAEDKMILTANERGLVEVSIEAMAAVAEQLGYQLTEFYPLGLGKPWKA